MFIAHYGTGFAAKYLSPKVSLGVLFIAAEFIDLLWQTLLLLDIEQVRIEPVAGNVMPLVFEHYPVSHSLLAVMGWALLVGGAYWLLRRDRYTALVLGGLVIGHWGLDLIVHRPDLPLFPGSKLMLGLDVWSSLPLTLLIELPLFLLGVWFYTRATVARDATGRWGLRGLVAFLLLVYAGSLFGALPSSAEAVAWAGQLQWLLVLWAFWVDRHRRVRGHR